MLKVIRKRQHPQGGWMFSLWEKIGMKRKITEQKGKNKKIIAQKSLEQDACGLSVGFLRLPLCPLAGALCVERK